MKQNILLYTLLLLVIGLSAWTIRKEFASKEIAYIDIEKLVTGYNLKKDMERDAGQNLYIIQHAIDSLEMIRRTINHPGPTAIDSQIARAKYVYSEFHTSSTNQMNKTIWERLNPVIEQYGKEKGLEILIGANGTGSLLYADKGRDLTDDLIKYINSKYGKGN